MFTQPPRPPRRCPQCGIAPSVGFCRAAGTQPRRYAGSLSGCRRPAIADDGCDRCSAGRRVWPCHPATFLHARACHRGSGAGVARRSRSARRSHAPDLARPEPARRRGAIPGAGCRAHRYTPTRFVGAASDAWRQCFAGCDHAEPPPRAGERAGHSRAIARFARAAAITGRSEHETTGAGRANSRTECRHVAGAAAPLARTGL